MIFDVFDMLPAKEQKQRATVVLIINNLKHFLYFLFSLHLLGN